MGLTVFLRVFRRHWVAVLLAAVLGFTLAFGWVSTKPKVYQSASRLFVTAPKSETSLSQGGIYAIDRAAAYAALVKGYDFTSAAIKTENLDMTPAELSGRIWAAVEVNTPVITIAATAPTAAEAQRLTEQMADALVAYVPKLETPSTSSLSKTPMKVSVVDDAFLPTAPIAPGVKKYVAVGLLMGLVLGSGYAVLRELLDDRLSSMEDINQAAGREVALLGVVPRDRKIARLPIADQLKESQRLAEELRMLRTNVTYLDPHAEHRCYVVTSSVPGEGRTSTVVNLAFSMASTGRKVLLIDADLRGGRVGTALGLTSSVGLSDILIGEKTFADAVRHRADLDVLPAGPTPPNPTELLGSAAMEQLLTQASTDYDIVLIDGTPLLSFTESAVLAATCQGTILVVRYRWTRVEEFARALARLTTTEARLCGVVVTRTPRKGFENFRQAGTLAPIPPTGRRALAGSPRERTGR